MAKFKKKGGSPSADRESPPRSAGDTTTGNVERERIEARAYELYLQRGRGDGAAMDDWLTAEREIGKPGDRDPQQS